MERAISYTTKKYEDLDISIERRGRRFQKRMPGEMAQNAGLTLPEERQRAMLECLERFYKDHRYRGMDDILIIFGVVQPETLLTSIEELQSIVPNLTKIYYEFSAELLILEFTTEVSLGSRQDFFPRSDPLDNI